MKNKLLTQALLVMEGAFGSFSYSLPTDKKIMIIDFYLLANMRPDSDNEDINLSIKESKDALYTALKKELLDAVFFSVACEFRHVWTNTHETKKDIAEWFEKKGYGDFLRKYIGSYSAWKNFGVKPDTSKTKIPHFEREKGSDTSRERHMSYRSAKIASEGDDEKFMQIAKDAMAELNWSSYFGGKNWAAICNGWLHLEKAETHQELELWIDHVYDLQHNTGTVFNKIKEYLRGEEKYEWIKKVLDWKANIVDPAALMDEASSEIKRLYTAYNASNVATGQVNAPAYSGVPTVFQKFGKRGAMSGEGYEQFKSNLKKGKGKYWKLSIMDLNKKQTYGEIKWTKPAKEIDVGQVVKVGSNASVVRYIGKLPSGIGETDSIWIDKINKDKKGNRIDVDYPSLAAMTLAHKEDITGVATYIEDVDLSLSKKPGDMKPQKTGSFKVGDEIEVVSGNYAYTKVGSIGKILSISSIGKAEIKFSKLTGAKTSSNKVWEIPLSSVKKLEAPRRRERQSETPKYDKLVSKSLPTFNINKMAEITNPASNYASYKKMAKMLKATNYKTGKADVKGILPGMPVKVLASAPAEKNPNYKIYLVQDAKGDQHLIGASGLKFVGVIYGKMNECLFSPKLQYIIERASTIMEMPWVELSPDKIVDLEFEKLRTKPEIMARIKQELEHLADVQQEQFIEKLFSDYWTMMNRYQIYKDEVKTLIGDGYEQN